MSRAGLLGNGRGLIPFASAVLLLAALPCENALARQETGASLTYYPSVQLRFVGGQARNYFFSQAQVVNISGGPITDLVLKQTFPPGFTPRLLAPEAQAAFKRPAGFSESLEHNAYTIKLPELRLAEATFLAVELTYEGRPASASFSGIEAEYSRNGQRYKEKGPDLSWDLSKYTRYSGTLREFIKRYAGMDMNIPDSQEDWGFSNLVARTAGKPATGPVEIETDQAGRLKFSIQAGVPGSLRQMIVIRRPLDPARQPKANDEVRRFVLDQVQVTADFTLDGDNISIQQKKVGRFNAWVADTKWRDRVKERLGEGPSRWYIFPDEKSSYLYVVNISAQGRGAGPGSADTPNPDKEQELMAQLEGIITSLRIL